ncbi:MAG TPA: phosphohistidine phosphatase SixA [Vicinamibacterales bacterium]|jgi:phosphohistidine phosphatase|nr:phosphohistidine phosphatase SixA [Vicinamibacterales bacterium]
MAGPYQLFLIRHGVAEERGDAWPDDAKRPLSEDGIERFQRSARGLARLDVWIDVVLTSPLVRARQTADIVASAFDPRPSIITIESLAPGGSYAALVADLEKHGRKTRIALVGHEPGIGELGARLIGSRHSFEFKKGAVCRIDVDEIPPVGPGDLRWFLTPKVMASIKKK